MEIAPIAQGGDIGVRRRHWNHSGNPSRFSSTFVAEPKEFIARDIREIAASLEDIMGLIIILIVGALVGWVAGMIMRSGGGLLFDIVIGIVGALIAGFLFGGGASIINAPLNLMAILYSLLGAIILLAIVKLIRRGSGGI